MSPSNTKRLFRKGASQSKEATRKPSSPRSKRVCKRILASSTSTLRGLVSAKWPNTTRSNTSLSLKRQSLKEHPSKFQHKSVTFLMKRCQAYQNCLQKLTNRGTNNSSRWLCIVTGTTLVRRTCSSCLVSSVWWGIRCMLTRGRCRVALWRSRV
jgi:hypothetical protein